MGLEEVRGLRKVALSPRQRAKDVPRHFLRTSYVISVVGLLRVNERSVGMAVRESNMD